MGNLQPGGACIIQAADGAFGQLFTALTSQDRWKMAFSYMPMPISSCHNFQRSGFTDLVWIWTYT